MERNIIFIIVSAVIGLALIAMYIVFSNIDGNFANGWYIAMLVIGILVLAFDGLLAFNVIKTISNADKEKLIIGVTFKDDFLMIDMTKDRKSYQQAKIAYQNILAFNVTKEYIFIRIDKRSTVPVLRSTEAVNFLKQKGVRKF